MNTAIDMNGSVIETSTAKETLKKEMDRVARVAELKGMLKEAINRGEDYVIIDIDRKFFYVDPDIQTPERTERSIEKLVKNWNPIKCLPLVGVPDFINGWMNITDGSARIRASYIVNPEKYQSMKVMVILNAPADPVERKRFEAELFINQGRETAKVTPTQKHGPRVVLGDPVALAIEQAKEKYDFEFYKHGGNRYGATNVGSYMEMYHFAEEFGFDGLDWVFDLCKKAGFDRKPLGYSKWMFRALRDMYRLYENERNNVTEILVDYLRDYNPKGVKADAMSSYPMLFEISAVSMFLEDVYTTLAKKGHMKRKVRGTRVVPA